jgi:hypothetical protein
MIYRRTLLIAALALLVAGAALAGPYERQISREFTAAGLSTFRLDNLAGRVTIQGGGGDEISVRATVFSEKSGKLSAQEVSDLLEIEFNEDDNRLEVKSRYPLRDYDRIHYGAESKGWFSGGNTTVRVDGKKVKITTGKRGGGLPLWVDFEITLPPGLDCDMRNYVGNVSFADMRGNCRADLASANFKARNQRGDLFVDCGSGDIKVVDMTGSLKVDTGSGDVEVENLSGDFDGDTGSGDILLRDGKGEGLKADTGSGEVTLVGVDYPRLHVDTGSGDVRVSTPGGEVANWEVDTGSGDVTFVFPPNGASFRLTADTGSGDIECELETASVKMRHGEIRALTVGDGEGRILVDTGSGDVSIREGS